MHQDSKYSFEQWIIQCCKNREWDLRKFIKKKLSDVGFRIIEDSFLSERCLRNSDYKSVHNLLMIRGENPRVCLVSHTDVCRDHISVNNPPDVYPTLKDKAGKVIIQDLNSEVQVGGDDRLGVAINTWIALNTGYDMAILLTTDEEVGLVSAGECNFPELKGFDLLVQVDRGNFRNELVTSIGGLKLCSNKIAKRLIKISEGIELRREVNGYPTDVYSIVGNQMCSAAVNLTCGYYSPHGKNEYIDVEESKAALKFVSEIIKYYDLNMDSEEIEEDVEEFIVSEPETIEFDLSSYIEISNSYLKNKKYKNHRGHKKARRYIEDCL